MENIYIFFNPLSSPQNCSIAVVGKGDDLSIYDDEDVNPYLEGLDQEERRGGAGTSRDAQPADAPAEGDASADQPPPPPSDEQPQVGRKHL